MDAIHTSYRNEAVRGNKMTEFKVTESGWYGTRSGILAEVIVYPEGCRDDLQFVEGYVDDMFRHYWTESGHCEVYEDGATEENEFDLVVYYGKEKPKLPKRTKWINLYLNGKAEIYSTEDFANAAASPNRIECRKIEWEVPDNG